MGERSLVIETIATPKKCFENDVNGQDETDVACGKTIFAAGLRPNMK